RLETDEAGIAQEIGVRIRDPVFVGPVEGARTRGVGIVRGPAIRGVLLGEVADVARFRPEVLHRVERGVEEHAQVEALHLGREPEAAGEGGIAVLIDPDHVARVDGVVGYAVLVYVVYGRGGGQVL